jgi:uncharacterized membrane protein
MAEDEPTEDEEPIKGFDLEAKTYKTWRNSRQILELARLITKTTKIIIGLAAVAVTLLVIAIFMLWRVLERLPS